MTNREIMDAVTEHHRFVENKVEPMAVVMTVLVGSQNYGLAHEYSDIDTCSFVLPTVKQLAYAYEPIATEYDVKDGKCVVKDIRSALNLLAKTNPNSIEWFCSCYNQYNEHYSDIIDSYLNIKNRRKFLYASPYNMANACRGMTYQLKNRNMPLGKKYSHALRVRDMWLNYVACNTDNILKFNNEQDRIDAYNAKLSIGYTDEELISKYDIIANEMNLITSNDLSINEMSEECQKYIKELQFKLMKRHLLFEACKFI